MKTHLKILTIPVLFCCTAVLAQDVSFIRVETSEPHTPLYQNEEGFETLQVKGMIPTSTSDRKWFRISAEYSTGAEWINRLTLEYYVFFPGETNVFKGVATYVDIPRGRGHLSDMYLHFNSYARHYKRGVIQYAVVALIDGKQVAAATNQRLPESWWKSLPIHPNRLLDRSVTPFAVFNIEKSESQDRSPQ